MHVRGLEKNRNNWSRQQQVKVKPGTVPGRGDAGVPNTGMKQSRRDQEYNDGTRKKKGQQE